MPHSGKLPPVNMLMLENTQFLLGKSTVRATLLGVHVTCGGYVLSKYQFGV